MLSLRTYTLKRILAAIPLVFTMILVSFVLIHLTPGDPVYTIAGQYGVTPEYIQMVRHAYGLDKPLYEQLLVYVVMVLRGDLGFSILYNSPVSYLILERLPATLLLMCTQLIIFSIIGVFLGVISSRKPYSTTDNLVTTVSLVGYSMPVFWLGQMLLILFSLHLGWLPVQGMISVREEYTGFGFVLDVMRHLVLPASSLGLLHLALISRLTRSSMSDVLGQDFVTTARSKGLDEKTVMLRHALRNALLPVVTVIGMNFGFILSGAVLTETVFAWPGLGRLMYEAIFSRDYPVVMGLFIFISVMVVIANLVTDVVYAFLDPRIRRR